MNPQELSQFSFPLTGKEREDKLLAAKKKLKSFRAKQNVLSASLSNASMAVPINGSSPSLSVQSDAISIITDSSVNDASSSNTSINTFHDFAPPIETPTNTFSKKHSFSTSSFSQHQHKRSMSTAKIPPPLKLENSKPHPFVAPSPSPQSQTHGRKPSHSRNKSKSGHSHKKSRNLSISNPAPKDFNKFNFGSNVNLSSVQARNYSNIVPNTTMVNPSPLLQSSLTVDENHTGRSSPSGSSPNTWVFPRKNVQSQLPRVEANLSVPIAQSAPHPPSITGSPKESRSPNGHSHSKTQSRHMRKSSVTTRAASLSLMGGIPFPNGKTSPGNPSNSGTPLAAPSPVPLTPQDLEQQRRNAFTKLEGRLREKREEIDLEGASERSLSPSPSFLNPHSPMVNNGHSNPSSPAFVPSPKTFSNLHTNKRNSWSGATTSGPFSNFSVTQNNGIGLGVGIGGGLVNETVASVGGKGANELGMLLEEEEEGEDNADEGADLPQKLTEATLSETISFPQSTPPRRFTPQRNVSNATSSHQSFGSSESGRSRSSFDENGHLSGNSGRRGLRNLTLSISGSLDNISGLNSPVKSASEKRRNSLVSPSPNVLPSPLATKGAPGVLRSLSMSGTPTKSVPSPNLDSSRSGWVNPNGRPRSRFNSLSSSVGGKRSSISYKKDTSNLPTTTPNSATFIGGSGFGGFGDLELAESESEPLNGLPSAQESNSNPFRGTHLEESSFLKSQIEKVKSETAAEICAVKSESNRLLKESKIRFLELEKQSKEEQEHLKNTISHLEASLERAKAAMEEGTAIRVSETEKLRNDLEELKIRNQEAEMERDELREDIEGWRTRVKNLEHSLTNERTSLEEERKENVNAREKIRKLGDRLQTATNDSKMTSELKEQIFNLVSTLEKERKEWESTKSLFEEQARKNKEEFEKVKQDLLAQLDAERELIIKEREKRMSGIDVPIEASDESELSGNETSSVTFKGPGSIFSTTSSRSSIGPASSSSSQRSSFGFNSLGGDSQYDMSHSSDDEISKYGSLDTAYTSESNSGAFKSGLSEFNLGGMSLGGLQTLAEEDEDEEALARLEETSGPNMEPFTTASENAETSYKQVECIPSVSEKTTSQKTHHQRSESFVKKWSFPKGPVVRSFEVEESHSFFGLNADHPSLPPLPFSETAALPYALTAGLSIEESVVTPSHIRRPSSPRPAFSPITPRRLTSFIHSAPPVSRSAHVARTSGSSQNSGSISVASSTGSSLAKRLSLQSFTALFGSYASLSPTAASLAVGASRLCSAGDDEPISPGRESSFELTRPLITRKSIPQSPAQSSRGSMRFINPNQQPLPISSSHRVLDFTKSCPCDSERLIVV